MDSPGGGVAKHATTGEGKRGSIRGERRCGEQEKRVWWVVYGGWWCRVDGQNRGEKGRICVKERGIDEIKN